MTFGGPGIDVPDPPINIPDPIYHYTIPHHPYDEIVRNYVTDPGTGRPTGAGFSMGI